MSNTLYVYEYAIASSLGTVTAFGFTPSRETPPDAESVLRGVHPRAEFVGVESVKCLGTLDRSRLRCMPSPASLRAAVTPLPANPAVT
jgi:hypothetical protein